VRAAALTNAVPQASVTPGQVVVTVEGRPAADGVRLEADPNVASDGYFDLLEVKVLGGRDFRESDTAGAPPVAIVNRAMTAFWGGADPIGGRFTVGPPQNRVTRTVVGVVEDFRLYGASERAIEAQFYVPSTQVPFPAGRLLVRDRGRIIILDQDEINWIQAEGDYVRVHVTGRGYLVRETMGAMEGRLDPTRFVRVHRSAIVNASRIRELAPQANREFTLVLRDGARLKSSRSYYDRLRLALGDTL
jgi:hypothetical protein